ncbi:MAG: T9SS type A sorting domain-containing protein [Flavobacteriales bacterium]
MVRTLRRWYMLPANAALVLVTSFVPGSIRAQVECTARPGILFAELNPVCFDRPATVIAAAYNMQPVVPEGCASLFLLTNGPDLVVRAVARYAQFIAPAQGTYHLHTLVYDTLAFDPAGIIVGTTTAFQLEGLLVQGGGDICGALDMQGAEVRVQDCTDCTAQPGSLTAYKNKDCLTNSTWIGAVPNGDAVVPAGFQVAYLFSHGPDGTIIGRSAEPWYQVTARGVYQIHTLVYDPATLDLSTIERGVTTAAEVDAWLAQSGGSICAGFDVPGTTIVVDDPQAGKLALAKPDACLVDGQLTLTATPDGGLHVPDGYAVAFLLSQGTSHVLVAVDPEPSFTVTTADYYSIHTLVYDPSYLDLSSIVLGTTTVADINGRLTQGGGHLCGSLDLTGADVKVDECDKKKCEANAGGFSMKHPIQCLVKESAELTAGPDLGTVLPEGYVKNYVLTRGPSLTILEVSDEASFTVDQPGIYRIHTLVYDPSTLDLSTIELGQTSAYDVDAQLQQGGGSICAALDMQGACLLVMGGKWCNRWNCQKASPEEMFVQQVVKDRALLRSVENDAPVAIDAWPNPVVDALTIDMMAYADAAVQVEVFDMTGRSVGTPLRIAAAEGPARLSVPMDGLQAGTYVVHITSGDRQESLRVVKAVR